MPVRVLPLPDYSKGNALALCDAFRRKSFADTAPENLLRLAVAITEFVGKASHYMTEYGREWPYNREISKNLKTRITGMAQMAKDAGWKKLVLPLEPVEENLTYTYIRDGIMRGLETAVPVSFQKTPYRGPEITAQDTRFDVTTPFSDGYRGMSNLAAVYGQTHPRRRLYLP